MKFLFDLFPVILFFLTYKLANGNLEDAATFATSLLGAGIAATQAPILLATAVAILATFAQVGWLLARGRKVDVMLWVSLVIIVVFGGATLAFHNPTFIKWKPTVLYWLFAAVLLGSALFLRKNLIRRLLGDQLTLPDRVWTHLNGAWIAFFVFMGVANLYVAYSFSENAWVNFKLYGGMGLMLAFVVVQGVMLARYIEEK
jgi:intracellular septation protein